MANLHVAFASPNARFVEYVLAPTTSAQRAADRAGRARRRVRRTSVRAGSRDHARRRRSSSGIRTAPASSNTPSVAASPDAIRVGIAYDFDAGDDRGLPIGLAAPRPAGHRATRARPPSMRSPRPISTGSSGIGSRPISPGRRACAGSRCPRPAWRSSSAVGTMAGRDRAHQRPRRVCVADRPVHDRGDPACGRARRCAPRATAPRGSGRTIRARMPFRATSSGARRWSSSAMAGSVARSPGSPRRTACASWRSRPIRPSVPTTASGCPAPATPTGTIPERIVGIDALREAAAEADFVSDHAARLDRAQPGDRQPRRCWKRCRPHAWLINTGRGPVVDEAALAEAAGRGAGSAAPSLDVFGEEPLPPSSPFWTPAQRRDHAACLGGVRTGAPRRTRSAENLRRFVAGEPLINRVDPQRGY